MRLFRLLNRLFVNAPVRAAAVATGLLGSVVFGADRPNILWITSEDNGPELGIYGDDYAVTPNLDALGRAGVVYTNAYSNAPVCAPARSTLITGMYPPALGSQHMRCTVPLPEAIRFYSHSLRDAGYYCTNNSKEDYNLRKPAGAWDESGRKAHWRKRGRNQPFFAIFNFTSSHESQIRRNLKADLAHNPAKVRVPAYHPDTPEVRRDWANYHDNLTKMDRQAGGILKQLREDGLAENTIVFYYGDHGPGMPRGKRWVYDSGLKVPLIVYFPEKYKHLAPAPAGTKVDRLVSFVDFGPTVLSLAGVKIPAHMQGEAFLGKQAKAPRDYIYGYRDRMDERIDFTRGVRDKRFFYVRNYLPQRKQAQFISYMYQMPTMRVWQQLYNEGKLNAAQRAFFEPKPVEELYDCETDPDQVKNLARDPKYAAVLARMREAHARWQREIIDVGFLPEAILRERSQGRTPYEMARDGHSYDFPSTRAAALAAFAEGPGAQEKRLAFARHADDAVRFWAITGLGWKDAYDEAALRRALTDASATVRVAAAEGLAFHGEIKAALPVLAAVLKDGTLEEQLHAGNILDKLDDQAASLRGVMEKALASAKQRGQIGGYVAQVLKKALSDLK